MGAQAIPTIDLPDLTLQANQANQTFTIQIENSGGAIDLTGVQLELMTGDGDVKSGWQWRRSGHHWRERDFLRAALCRQQHRRPGRGQLQRALHSADSNRFISA